MKRFVLFIVLLALLIPVNAASEEQIGVIKSSEGGVYVVRNGAVIPGESGIIIFENDVLKTDVKGSAGIVMTDETTISLGPNSELSFNEYLFNPKEGAFSVVMRFVKGTFAYMSGVIGKLSPESIRLETPDSTIAVRGTRLLIKVAD